MLDICIFISLLLLALVTSFIWIPIVILTSPVWGITLLAFFLVVRYTRLGGPIKSVIFGIYNWVLYKSERPRSYLWRRFYDFLAWMFPQEEWKTMNYGYAV
jgi:hypothetical protein